MSKRKEETFMVEPERYRKVYVTDFDSVCDSAISIWGLLMIGTAFFFIGILSGSTLTISYFFIIGLVELFTVYLIYYFKNRKVYYERVR